jgi:hypothetical protein
LLQIQRYIAFLMAFLVFGTSVCFSIDNHICKGEVWSTSYFGKADVCEMMQKQEESEVMSCCSGKAKNQQSSNHGSQVKKAPCCSQETYVNNSIDGKIQMDSFDVNFELNTVYFDLAKSFNFSYSSREKVSYITRPPPDYERDFQSYFQVFII